MLENQDRTHITDRKTYLDTRVRRWKKESQA